MRPGPPGGLKGAGRSIRRSEYLFLLYSPDYFLFRVDCDEGEWNLRFPGAFPTGGQAV